jgi:hypothetical protein
MKGFVLPDSKPPFVMKFVGVAKHGALDDVSSGVETIDDELDTEEALLTDGVALGVISAGIETIEDGVELGDTLRDETDGVDEVSPIDNGLGTEEKPLPADGVELGDTWGKTDIELAALFEDISNRVDDMMPTDDKHGAEDK